MSIFMKAYNLSIDMTGSGNAAGFMEQVKRENFQEPIAPARANEIAEAVRAAGAPNFRPCSASEQAERLTTMNLARDNLSKLLQARTMIKDARFPAYGARQLPTILSYTGNARVDARENEKILDAVNGSQAEKRRLFENVMHRMAEAKPAEWLNLSDRELAEKLPEIMPVALIGFESETLIGVFERMGVELTPEDREQWRALGRPLNDVMMNLTGRLDQMTSACYPAIDNNRLPKDYAFAVGGLYELQAGSENEDVPRLNEAEQDYFTACNVARSNESTVLKANIADQLRAKEPGLDLRYVCLNDKPSLTFVHDEKANLSLDSVRLTPHARAGKIVYAYSGHERDRLREQVIAEAEARGERMAPNETNEIVEKEHPELFHAFVDLHGNGYFTEVTPEQARKLSNPPPKPWGITRFFHNVSKAFGGKGIASVNAYDSYQNDFLAPLKAINEGKSSYTAFEETAAKTQAEYKDRISRLDQKIRLEHDVAEVVRKGASVHRNEAEMDVAVQSLLGTKPVPVERQVKRGCYKESDVDVSEFSVPEGCAPYGEKDFANIAFAALSHPDVAKTFKNQGVPEGLTPEENVGRVYTHLSMDLFYQGFDVSRQQSGHLFGTFHAARAMTADCLKAYAEGNKQPLADLLTLSVRHQTHMANPDNETYEVMYPDTVALEKTLELLQRDPELAKLGGLTEAELKETEIMIARRQPGVKAADAKAALGEAALGKRELTPEEKERFVLDALTENVIQHMDNLDRERFKNTDKVFSGIEAETDELRNSIALPENKDRIKEIQTRIDQLGVKQNIRLRERPAGAATSLATVPGGIEQLQGKLRGTNYVKELMEMPMLDMVNALKKRESGIKAFDEIKPVPAPKAEHAVNRTAPELSTKLHLEKPEVKPLGRDF